VNKYTLGSETKKGTIITILDNKISSKEKGEKYFNGKWYKDEAEAEKAWNYLVKNIGKKYSIEINEKYYPATGKMRREMTILQQDERKNNQGRGAR